MIRERLELLVDEDAVSLLAGLVLERQRDQVAEAAPGHRVLVWEETVVGLHAELVAAAHRLGDEVAAHPSRDVRVYRRGEEEPRVCAVPRAGALDRDGYADGSAGFGKCGDVFLPRALVEIGSEKPAALILEERVDAHHVSALQVVDDDLVADRDEGLVRAVAALASGLEHAEPGLPLVRARGGVACLAGLLAHEPRRKDVRASAEQRTEQLHLVRGRVRRLAVRRERQGQRRRSGCSRELGPEALDPCPCLVTRALERREPLLLAGEILKDGVLRARHVCWFPSSGLGARCVKLPLHVSITRPASPRCGSQWFTVAVRKCRP